MSEIAERIMFHKTIFSLVFLITIILPSSVSAGTLYGNIVNEKGRPIKGASVKVTMERSKKQYEAAGPTDASGSYRVVIPETGRGTLEISDSSGMTPIIRVYVFQSSVRWNLKRVKGNSGAMLQKR
jgi:hypothetical protein